MIDQILNAIKEEQKNTAMETMRLTSGDVFALGVQIGMFRGLEHSERIIAKLLDEQDRRDQRR